MYQIKKSPNKKMFDWQKLLNRDRRRPTKKNEKDRRREFDRDYDRVIYCSAFRRLKDKAQVFPLERNDFVRTRLAHSLEVSTLGRSFGTEVYEDLIAKKRITSTYQNDIPTILSTSCLLHDIGNPPFGHFGEESIRSWFKEYSKRNKKSKLNKAQKEDFKNFEGNAQGFRLVTYTQFLDDDKGLNLTYGTLASLIKYPCSSTQIKNNGPKAFRKFGYFQKEKEVFKEVIEKTGLKENSRHPLVFLMEAADDVAYSTIDIEDALRKREISCQTFVDFMRDKLKGPKYKKLIDKFEDSRNELRSTWGKEQADSIAIQKFRIDSIGRMFRACVDAFSNNYDKIMEGDFSEQLINVSEEKDLYETCKEFARNYVYVLPSVLSLEILGCKVIHGLLDIFVDAIKSNNRNNSKTKEGKLFILISHSLRNLATKFGNNIEDEDTQYHLATDYISGMTDNHALNVYQNLTGIRIGGIK
jgi:dGTPase